MVKLIRTSTIAMSLDILLRGQLNYLSHYFEILAVSGEDELLRNVENREKINVFPINMERNISPIKDLVSMFQLYNLFRKEKPLIVHSITPKAGLLSMIAAYFADVPIRIHTFTGLIFPTKYGVMQKLLIAMDKLLCKCASNIYPEGEGVRNDLIKFKITNKPMKVLGNGNVNGIDTIFFNPINFSKSACSKLRNELKISSIDFVFIFVGRLVKDKGINELVEAFENLNGDKTVDNNKKLLLVGPLETRLDPLNDETLHRINQNSNIISVGFKKDIRPYLAISDAFVFPSYREGFPNVVMQAGAMGLPCIVTDINGSNEIIIEGFNGLIISIKDVEALKNSMNLLINNPEKRTLLAKNSRQRIIDNYEQKYVWDFLLNEYIQLMDEKGIKHQITN